MELQPALMSEGVFFLWIARDESLLSADRKPVRQGTTGLEAGTLLRSVPSEAF